MKEHSQLKNDIRYAIRLTQRTARLYRRIQTTGTFLFIIGGSATFASLAGSMPAWLTIIGGVLLAVAGAIIVSTRPAERVAQNESDMRRYQSLMAKADKMDVDALAVAIEEAHEGDAQEVEPLREIAFNDIALESNRPDVLIPLSRFQKILRAFA
jgi:hypothetical protein